MNTAELEQMKVVDLRKLAKDNHIKLGAGIDKAGIVQKIAEVLCTGEAVQPESSQAAPAPQEPQQPVGYDGASVDVTAAAPAYRRWTNQQVSNYQQGWQQRNSYAEEQSVRTNGWQQRSRQTVTRFGPQNTQQQEASAYDAPAREPIRERPAQQPAPAVTADGYRLGYRAAPQRPYQQRGYDRQGYQNYDRQGYDQRPSGYNQPQNSRPAMNGNSDYVYRMERDFSFEEQRAQGMIPSVLQVEETQPVSGILEILPDGYGFLRSEALRPSASDIYVAAAMVRRYRLRTGDRIAGKARSQKISDKYAALLTVDSLNGAEAIEDAQRPLFDELSAVYPQKRIVLGSDDPNENMLLRLVDLVAPVGFGQRALITAPPDSGATDLLVSVSKAIRRNDPQAETILLLIDALPEEVTEIREKTDATVFSSTFADTPEMQLRVCETMLEYTERLVENGKNAVILLDSLTKFTRACQSALNQGARPMSNSITPAALTKPKHFFGAARNTREGGSLTIIATIAVDTGSRIDEIIYEEFKGTANMDLALLTPAPGDPVYPMPDLSGSGTKKNDILLTDRQKEALSYTHKLLEGAQNTAAVKQLCDMMSKTRDNEDLLGRLHDWYELWKSSQERRK